MITVVTETFAVGLAVMILGLVIMWAGKTLLPQSNFNTVKAHAIMLFILGVILYLLSEWLGINAWYCQNGAACKA